MKAQTRTNLFLILTATVAALTLPATGQSATIGYWRFETGAETADSSGNGLTLTASTSAPLSYTLPATGAGHYFPTTIPQTSQSNTAAAQGTGTTQSWSAGNYATADAPILNITTALTVETFINLSTGALAASPAIVGQGANSTVGASWAFTVSRDGSGLGARNLIFQQQTIAGGWSPTNIDSDLALTAGVDYYAACSVDFANLQVVFYLQDLNGGAMQTATKSLSSSSLAASSQPLTIGAGDSTGSAIPFSGTIDEVRLSNSILSQSELLISVPEPSTVLLILLGAGSMCWRRKR